MRTRLVLEAVAKEEGIQVTSEEVAATIDALARSSENSKEVYDAFTNSPRALSLAGDILRNKAVEVVIAAAKAVDSEGNPVDLSIDEEPLDIPGNGQEVNAVEAEIVESGPDTTQVSEARVFEAEIVDEES